MTTLSKLRDAYEASDRWFVRIRRSDFGALIGVAEAAWDANEQALRAGTIYSIPVAAAFAPLMKEGDE